MKLCEVTVQSVCVRILLNILIESLSAVTDKKLVRYSNKKIYKIFGSVGWMSVLLEETHRLFIKINVWNQYFICFNF